MGGLEGWAINYLDLNLILNLTQFCYKLENTVAPVKNKEGLKKSTEIFLVLFRNNISGSEILIHHSQTSHFYFLTEK